MPGSGVSVANADFGKPQPQMFRHCMTQPSRVVAASDFFSFPFLPAARIKAAATPPVCLALAFHGNVKLPEG
jgi:hypothetical protein